MKNFVQPGNVITLPAPYALTPGAGALVGAVFGVSSGTYALNDPAELQMQGVYDLTALGTDTVAANTPAAAYWDNANKRVTTTASGNTKIGVIIAAKANGDATARVRLNGSF